MKESIEVLRELMSGAKNIKNVKDFQAYVYKFYIENPYKYMKMCYITPDKLASELSVTPESLAKTLKQKNPDTMQAIYLILNDYRDKCLESISKNVEKQCRFEV